MSKYSKLNIVYLMQKWMDSVAGQTFLNYAYSWGAAIVILGTLFKLTHLEGANIMLFIGMGTEVLVFFISAFDRPFDKTADGMDLDNHMSDKVISDATSNPLSTPAAMQGVPVVGQPEYSAAIQTQAAESESDDDVLDGGTVIIGSGMEETAPSVTPAPQVVPVSPVMPVTPVSPVVPVSPVTPVAPVSPAIVTPADAEQQPMTTEEPITFQSAGNDDTVATPTAATRIVTPAPAVSPETAARMEVVTSDYITRLDELNELLQKVAKQSARLTTDSEEMENLNRTLTGISRVYEMQLKSASQQITTQDQINEQTRIMAEKIQELNSIYTRMIEAMTTNMPGRA